MGTWGKKRKKEGEREEEREGRGGQLEGLG